ncbi:MAG TPA: GIY-YIG nuclease family protein [Chthoniobacterales bacterium]|nr:GIY-YIG nuclease family protein [Chthoniobacterales bacterium]
MKTFAYVYILKSQLDSRRFYVGSTFDLRVRLTHPNQGQVPYTAKWKRWRLKTYIAFSETPKAKTFERYLKSVSGRAFVKKQL